MRTINFPFSGLQVSFSKKAVKEQHTAEHSMGRKKVYWLTQLSGWSFYALINLVVIATFKTLSVPKALWIILLSVLGAAFTNLFRNYIKKHNWIALPLKKLIPRVLVACSFIGMVIYLLMFGLNLYFKVWDMADYKAGSAIIEFINLSAIILVWSLIYFAAHFFEHYKKVEIESLIWEAAVKDFELKTLKSQLNPHFMFNALNSIRALIDEDPASAQTAVTKLSNILRYSLRIDSTETVSLQDEMQTVADYLALETVRFEERLKYTIQLDPKSLNVEIPPMMIQTLVENGIKHGISKKTSGGKINVHTRITDSVLHVQIKNSGQIDEQAVLHSKGFGINNTRHRLNLLYGEKASFSIKNCSADEVITELAIPTGGINK